MKLPLASFFLKYTSNLFYLAGVSIIIPVVINLSVPNRVLFVDMPRTLLVITAVILVALGMAGTYLRRGELSESFKTLGFMTLVPAIASAYILVFGDRLLIGIAEKARIEPLVDFSLRGVPGVWVLTGSYLIVTVAWLWLWKKFK